MNRTVMIHFTDGEIFCIDEQLFIEIIRHGRGSMEEYDVEPIGREMATKLIKHLGGAE